MKKSSRTQVRGWEGRNSFQVFQDEIPGTRGKKIEIPIALRHPGERDDGHGGADTKMMNEFISSIIEDRKPAIDVDMGIRMSIPGILAHESALQGGVAIEIPDLQ